MLPSIALLRAAVGAVRAEALAGVSAVVVGECLVELDVVVARLRFEQSRFALAFDCAGGPLDDGFQSAQSWLRANTMAGPGEAKDLVTTGRALRDRLPATSDAAADGQVSWAHASAIAHALRQVQDPDALAEADRALAEAAPTLNPTGIAHAARRLLQHLDPDLAQRDAAQRYADRSLTLSPMLDGAVSVHGQLDEDSAAVILSALSPMMTPLGPDDTRTAAQRRVDILVELVAKAAEVGAAGTMTGTGLPPTLLVRVDIAALADLKPIPDPPLDSADDREPGDRCDEPPGARPRVPPPAEVDWGGPILRQTL
ncbi:MAG: putative endonuclease, partial [Pseudonocardiales bacterium]|nr:putative endonuclease [Pseudonocardiales bacterium]